MGSVESEPGGLPRLAQWIRKNVLAQLKSRGFEIVRVRARGSSRIRTRLIRGTGAVPAARPEPVALQPGRYFTVELEARPGINHLRFALDLLVREAVSLGRTPLVFKPRFDPRHNLGRDLDVEWDRYIDLQRVHLMDGAHGCEVCVAAVRPQGIADLDRLSTAWFERDHVVTDAENRSYELIVRRNKTGLSVDRVHGGPAGLPGYGVRFEPSAKVLDRVEKVRGRLGGYAAMHVRRDDMLEMKDLYPNLDRDTRPERILETLSQYLPQGARVYIMTNERDQRFFEPLRASFEVFQYFDFPELRELIDSDQPDNFLLFEIEKLLFERASTKIHTFTHPEGGRRISLTTDKGWA